MEGNGIGRGGRRIEAGAARILAADERAAPRKVDSARNGSLQDHVSVCFVETVGRARIQFIFNVGFFIKE